MGIRYLNRVLRSNCPNSVRCISLADLSGKKIAVDISIYMYKYETEGLLIENIYLMLSIFRYYNIIPVFIFDGKPPAEKKELLQKRRSDRLDAENEYKQLKKQYEENSVTMDEDDKQELVSTMDQLKKQFIYINKTKIQNVKDLIISYGASYYDAPGEADELCAMLVIKKKVWACLTEDMDLFVYGCTRVLRYFSLLNHTAVLYYLKGILTDMSMTQKEFRELCVISGTDYNLNANGDNTNITLNNALKLFTRFKNTNSSTNTDFYRWLMETENNISDYELLNKINDIFDLKHKHENLDSFNKIKISNSPINRDTLKQILEEDGFMFID
jgi:flap endonuclease-1